ncbi:MAG: formate dehydrogenase accessory sulfurtransferase FdhD [Deltaproteobacteria bacterium]|nr:formate dehydrogenase accessory sulfurtransferase FdhD [Deltaproteobacteria bacterium]
MTTFQVERLPSGHVEDDLIAVEAPLEIVVDGVPLAVLLRTPSTTREDDLDLAAGFLLTEGVIEALDDLAGLTPCIDPAALDADNRVLVALAAGVPRPTPRAFAAGTSCGLCGVSTLEDLARRLPPRAPAAPPTLTAIGAMEPAVRSAQAAFRASGALHAAAVFDGATLMDHAEDVGRHNAVDKVIGRALRARRLPLVGRVLWVSGRVSFDLVQKALVAGLDALVAVGAPTSLAVELARAQGLHLVGFSRDGRANVYAGQCLRGP